MKNIFFVLGFLCFAKPVMGQVPEGGGGGGVASGGVVENTLSLKDDVALKFGTGLDLWVIYDSSDTRLEWWSSNINGAGLDGMVAYVEDGTDEIVLVGGQQHLDDIKAIFGTGSDFWITYNSTGTALEIWSTNVGAGVDGRILYITDGGNTLGLDGSLTIAGDASLGDGDKINYGAAPDFWTYYDSGDTRLELWSTNVGAGADGMIFYITDGGNDIVYEGDVTVTGTLKPLADTGLGDNIDMGFGNTIAAPDYWVSYDSGDTRLEFFTTDGTGAGVDTMYMSVDDGTDDVTFSGVVSAANVSADELFLGDNDKLNFGNTTAAPDQWVAYDSGDTRLEFWTTDSNGAGLDAMTAYVDDGTDDWAFSGDVSVAGPSNLNEVAIGDGDKMNYGNTAAAPDFWTTYDSGDTRLEYWSTDTGSGTDGMYMYVEDGTNDVSLPGSIYFDAAAASGSSITMPAMSSDAASVDNLIIRGPGAYSKAATNTQGGHIALSGGLGTNKVTALQATGTGTIIYLYKTLWGVSSVTTITEGVQYSCAVDNDTCAANLVTYINSNITGVGAEAVSNAVYVYPASDGISDLMLDSANGSGGGTAFAVVRGNSGDILLPHQTLVRFGAPITNSVYVEGWTTTGSLGYGSSTAVATWGAGTGLRINSSANTPTVNWSSSTILNGSSTVGDGKLKFTNAAGTSGGIMQAAAADTFYFLDLAGTGYSDLKAKKIVSSSKQFQFDTGYIIQSGGSASYPHLMVLDSNASDGGTWVYNTATETWMATQYNTTTTANVSAGTVTAASTLMVDTSLGTAITKSGYGGIKMTSQAASWNHDTTLSAATGSAVAFPTTPGAATATVTGVRVAKKFIYAMSGKLLTGYTGCTKIDVGDGVDDDRYAYNIAVATNTIWDSDDSTADPSEWLATAGDVVITGYDGARNPTNCIGGNMAVRAHTISVNGL
jgi:hypothetical protein